MVIDEIKRINPGVVFILDSVTFVFSMKKLCVICG